MNVCHSLHTHTHTEAFYTTPEGDRKGLKERESNLTQQLKAVWGHVEAQRLPS